MSYKIKLSKNEKMVNKYRLFLFSRVWGYPRGWISSSQRKIWGIPFVLFRVIKRK